MREDLIVEERVYMCAICGNGYSSITERMNCEQACLKKQEEVEKKAAEAKKAAEQKIRKEAVDEAVANAFRLVNAYIKDYGHYESNSNIIKDFILPSRIWNYFR